VSFGAPLVLFALLALPLLALVYLRAERNRRAAAAAFASPALQPSVAPRRAGAVTCRSSRWASRWPR
jgi:Ca-activated chloride channel family protein